jgi:hypothetical protein
MMITRRRSSSSTTRRRRRSRGSATARGGSATTPGRWATAKGGSATARGGWTITAATAPTEGSTTGEGTTPATTTEEEAIVVLVVGVAAELASHGKFYESIMLEEWWHKTHSEWLQKDLKVNIICPHSNSILYKSELMHHKQALSLLHDIVVDESGSQQ